MGHTAEACVSCVRLNIRAATRTRDGRGPDPTGRLTSGGDTAPCSPPKAVEETGSRARPRSLYQHPVLAADLSRIQPFSETEPGMAESCVVDLLVLTKWWRRRGRRERGRHLRARRWPMTDGRSTPRADGFSMPAEWERHQACFMEWPTLTRRDL